MQGALAPLLDTPPGTLLSYAICLEANPRFFAEYVDDMRILIVGAGAVGSNLARQLSDEGHDVSMVEGDAELATKLSERLDAHVVQGNATTPSILESAGIERAGMLIAVTDLDEVNIVVCLLASKYGVATTVARLRNEELSGPGSPVSFGDSKEVRIDQVINPEGVTVNSVMDLIGTPGSTDVAEFANGDILLRGFDVTPEAPIAGRTLAGLKDLAQTDQFLIVGILRKGQGMVIARGDQEILAGDRIFVLVARYMLPFFLPLVNRRVWATKKVVIFGASRTGLSLALRLEEVVDNITVIEPDTARAEEAAATLQKSLVLKGMGTDVDVLREANVQAADFFVSAIEDEEPMLLAALLAKKQGAKKTIVITSEPDYVPIINSLDVDAVINPRLLTVNAILRYVRRGKILSVVQLGDSDAEVIEMVVVEGSKLVGKPLKKIRFPDSSLVGAIHRGDMMTIPHGDTVAQAGDRMVVFALPGALPKVQALFSG